VTTPRRQRAEELWQRHDRAWRDPVEVVTRSDVPRVDPHVLAMRASRDWWDVLAALRVTLIVTREYEHLVMALSAGRDGPRASFFPLPHPSGIAVDRQERAVYVASTRNPNQVVRFEPSGRPLRRRDLPAAPRPGSPLLPVRTVYYPGSLYLHDLAMIDGALHGTATGHNTVVRLREDGRHEAVWWPRCVEHRGRPNADRNVIQLNTIAAGETLARSFFGASTDRPSARRPGHRNFAVDGRGVLFDGSTRETVVRGLTRPHSARLAGGRVWVANSGYGELGVCAGGAFTAVARLPGWVRGLCIVGGVAFAGTSRIIPRFRHYAPGVDADRAVCGVHAVELGSGRVLGSLTWPYGNQIFGCDWLPSATSAGFPFPARRRRNRIQDERLFYTFTTGTTNPKRTRER
jgi:uncharacterized protein (TIGR03032 family)